MLPLLLLACMGPSDTTIIRDVQIVHVGASPAELQPGESSTLTVTVADPSQQGVEILAWPCTDLGEGCAEDLGQPVSEWVSLLSPVDEDATWTVTASPLWAKLLSADTGSAYFEPYAGAWFQACRPGECAPIELARSTPAAGSDDDVALRAFLNDPTAGMAELPLDGAALAQRRVPVSDRGEDERNQNPELRLEDERELTLAVGGEQELLFGLIDETPDALQLDGYTSIGTLGPARTDFYSPTFTWYAGEAAGEGRIYVVVRDGEGGSALWRQDAVVE
jgi:hypothetical protein